MIIWWIPQDLNKLSNVIIASYGKSMVLFPFHALPICASYLDRNGKQTKPINPGELNEFVGEHTLHLKIILS
jgi:hypothetical protein